MTKTSQTRLESNRRYAQRNPELIRAIKRKYYYKHRGKEILRNTKYRKRKWFMKIHSLIKIQFEYIERLNHQYVFHCMFPDCGKTYFMLGPHLYKHFLTHDLKGGENNMSNLPVNAWTYEEIEEIIPLGMQGKAAYEIRTLVPATIAKSRKTSAINGLLRKFQKFIENDSDEVISNSLRNHFTRFLREHKDEISGVSNINITENTESEVTETPEQPEQEEGSVEETTETDYMRKETIEPLEKWFQEGGPIIIKVINSEVARRTGNIQEENESLKADLEATQNAFSAYKLKVKNLLSEGLLSE